MDIEPLDIDPLDIEAEALAFFFFMAIFLSVIAPLDIEPLDIEPLDEPLDIEPELLDCARAEPPTATLNTAAATNTESLDILYSRDWPHSRDRCCFTSVKRRSASPGAAVFVRGLICPHTIHSRDLPNTHRGHLKCSQSC